MRDRYSSSCTSNIDLGHVARLRLEMHRIDIAYAKRCLTADAAFRAQAPSQGRRGDLVPGFPRAVDGRKARGVISPR